MGVKREKFFQTLLTKRSDELLSSVKALVARMEQEATQLPSGRVRGLPSIIDPNRPPKNCKDAMSREDRQEWAEAYDNEHQVFFENKRLKIARPEPATSTRGKSAGDNNPY